MGLSADFFYPLRCENGPVGDSCVVGPPPGCVNQEVESHSSEALS